MFMWDAITYPLPDLSGSVASRLTLGHGLASETHTEAGVAGREARSYGMDKGWIMTSHTLCDVYV